MQAFRNYHVIPCVFGSMGICVTRERSSSFVSTAPDLMMMMMMNVGIFLSEKLWLFSFSLPETVRQSFVGMECNYLGSVASLPAISPALPAAFETMKGDRCRYKGGNSLSSSVFRLKMTRTALSYFHKSTQFLGLFVPLMYSARCQKIKPSPQRVISNTMRKLHHTPVTRVSHELYE